MSGRVGLPESTGRREIHSATLISASGEHEHEASVRQGALSLSEVPESGSRSL